MSWDQIEITAADAGGAQPATHPVQMIMSASECIKVPYTYPIQRCMHSSRMRARYDGYTNSLQINYEVVQMHLYGIEIPMPWLLSSPDMYGRVPCRYVTWLMGLCSCGKLYWCGDGDRYV